MSEPVIFGQHEESTLAQARDVASRAEYFALMADGHLGYVMPIGGVAAYDNKVSMVGVGVDIACGNCAIRTDLRAEDLADRLETIADEIKNTIAFGAGRTNQSDDAPVEHPLFDDPAWEAVPPQWRHNLKGMAVTQLGTVGGGNHYVDVFADDDGFVWVGVHFGSRGFGYNTAYGFMALAENQPWDKRVPEKENLLDLSTSLGEAYWSMMGLAGQYAYAGREWVARKAVAILGGKEQEMVHNHHNFAWREYHRGRDLVVIRKGATPAFPGERGFVGGSMGDDAVILRGAISGADPDDLEVQALYSTVHGAGRVMSRTAAKGKHKKGVQKTPGLVTRQMMSEWTKGKGVVVRGGDVDEAPQVYRRLPDVLAAQGDTIVIERTLKPLIVVMADAREFDPYKD